MHNEEIEQLRKERVNRPHHQVSIKMDTLFLKSQDYSHQKIGEMVDTTHDTRRTYLEPYRFFTVKQLDVFSHAKNTRRSMNYTKNH